MRCNLELNVKKTLENCQEKQQPYVYWDLIEFDQLSYFPFPFIELKKDFVTQDLPGWKRHVDPFVIDLDNPQEVEKGKQTIRSFIEYFEHARTNIGFAIIARDENRITVQAFTD